MMQMKKYRNYLLFIIIHRNTNPEKDSGRVSYLRAIVMYYSISITKMDI